MEIKVSRLLEIMELLKPAVPKNPTTKVLSSIFMGDGQAIATDLDTAIIANVPEAKEPVLLPYARIAEVLKYVDGNDLISIDLKGRTLSLKWKTGKASYPTEDIGDFPTIMPPDLAVKAEGMIDGDKLINAFNLALPYVSDDDKNTTLTGIWLMLGNSVEVVGGDGFRLSVQTLSGVSYPSEAKVIIRGASVGIINHVFSKTPRTPPGNAQSVSQLITAKRNLRVSLMGESKLRMDFGISASVVANLIDGKIPNYNQMVPSGEPILKSDLSAPHFEAAVQRVKKVAKAGNGIVRLEFANGQLNVSASHEDDEIFCTIDVIHTQGEPSSIALNEKYLLEYLKGKDGIITFTRYTEQGPVTFEYGKTPKVLIMPMFVEVKKSEPEPAAETPSEEKAEAEGEAETDKRDAELDAEEEAAKAETEEVVTE
jgi:DNA polymerase III sliding clamp (beta) subunit (PCNA family)